MKNTSLPSVNHASDFSQWLYLHTALGKGYQAPISYLPCWVLTSAVPDSLCERMRNAENEFHDRHEREIRDDKQRLEELEQLAKATNNSDRKASIRIQIKALKEKLSATTYVNYRDWTADRATIMEMLSKSKFRSMSFTDELGIRAHGYTINKFLAAKNICNDLALLSLTGDQSADSVLIRSSATGGANIVSVRGCDSPRFNLMTLSSAKAIDKIVNRLKEAAPAKGKTLAITSSPGSCLDIQADHIAKVIEKIYATQNVDNRVSVNMSQAWESFIGRDDSDITKISDAATSALNRSLANVKLLVTSITRAIITRRIFLEAPDLPGADHADRTIQLSDEDLQLAETWYGAMRAEVFGLQFRDVRANNAAKARQAKMSGPSVEELIAAKAALVAAIRKDPDNAISYSSATKIKGVTSSLLPELLSSYPDVFRLDYDYLRPGAKRPASCAIMLAENVDHISVSDQDVSIAGTHVTSDAVDDAYREMAKKAEKNLRRPNGKPAVAISSDPALPDRSIAIMVMRKYWQSTTMIPDKRNGVSYLWFRFKSDGSPMCDWAESFREEKLLERWNDKDAHAETERNERSQTQNDNNNDKPRP